MAITNKEIISLEMATRGIEEEVHTFAMWKSLGYQVKKGEKALFQTMLWKMKKGKKQDNNNEEQQDNNKEKEVKNYNNFFMAKSSLFGRSQVELIC